VTAFEDIGRIRHSDRFFIGGEWVAPSSSDTIDVIAPATEDVFVKVAAAREADIDRAVAAARKLSMMDHGGGMSHGERDRTGPKPEIRGSIMRVPKHLYVRFGE
jgi:hypothetical protein